MTLATFTKAEQAAIRDGFDAISYACDRCAHEYASRLREAFKDARKTGQGADWARAMLCSQFFDGVEDPASADYLFGLNPAARMAHMLGAAMRASYPDHMRNALSPVIKARIAVRAALARRVAST